MTTTLNRDKIALKYGLLASGGLVGLFLIASFTGYANMLQLRVLNALVLFPGIWFSLRYFIKRTNTDVVYLRSLILGLQTAAVAVIPFALFLFTYLQIDTTFMLYLRENAILGKYLSPFIISFVVFFEGMMSGVLFSYISMQYMKKYAASEVPA